jgi:signal transduction histidine kinase
MNTIPAWIRSTHEYPKLISGFFCIVGLWLIGFVDYLLGYQISLLVFYILPIAFAALYVGPRFAVLLSLIGMVIWKMSDFLAGLPYEGAAILVWNGAIFLSLCGIVIYLVNALKRTLFAMESAVDERTLHLCKEMKERRFLERKILELSERENQWFGQETHVICQKLANLSIASHALARKLLATDSAQAEDALNISKMMDTALMEARMVARGLCTPGFDEAALVKALGETAWTVQEQHRLRCDVFCDQNLALGDETSTIHLFRIAQEAIQNAARHSGASRISVSLKQADSNIRLVIEDNGKGITPRERAGYGLGLRIMAYRAGMIGGELKIETSAAGGARIICEVPAETMAVKMLPRQMELPVERTKTGGFPSAGSGS